MQGYNFNLDQTKSNVLPPKLQNCTLGRHRERSERLPDSPDARAGAFPEGCFSFASSHQGGNLLAATAAGGNLQKRQASFLSFLIFLVCRGRWPPSRVRGLHKVSSHRGVFPGRCRCILAQEGSAAFLFDSEKRLASALGLIPESCAAM